MKPLAWLVVGVLVGIVVGVLVRIVVGQGHHAELLLIGGGRKLQGKHGLNCYRSQGTNGINAGFE